MGWTHRPVCCCRRSRCCFSCFVLGFIWGRGCLFVFADCLLFLLLAICVCVCLLFIVFLLFFFAKFMTLCQPVYPLFLPGFSLSVTLCPYLIFYLSLMKEKGSTPALKSQQLQSLFPFRNNLPFFLLLVFVFTVLLPHPPI